MDYLEFLQTKYCACYQENSFKWVCDCSSNSYAEADKFSAKHHMGKGQTILVPINNICPDFVKERILENKLKPKVSLSKETKDN